MTTRANNKPVYLARCNCGSDLVIYQARGKRAYLYCRCAVCGFQQEPHSILAQARLWDLLPPSIQADIRRPMILDAARRYACPCCGRAAA